jgi:hypothetical protein
MSLAANLAVGSALKLAATGTTQRTFCMVTETEEKAGKPPVNKAKAATSYPGKNDGRISASKNAGMRPGASRPGPKKK